MALSTSGGAAPAGSNNHNRLNLTLYESADGGLSWSTVRVVYAGLGAYSDMVWLPERGGIGVLFERGAITKGGVEHVRAAEALDRSSCAELSQRAAAAVQWQINR